VWAQDISGAGTATVGRGSAGPMPRGATQLFAPGEVSVGMRKTPSGRAMRSLRHPGRNRDKRVRFIDSPRKDFPLANRTRPNTMRGVKTEYLKCSHTLLFSGPILTIRMRPTN